MLAKLQAVSSKKRYSLQGFEALILPSAGHVCHSLMVVSNCTPGSAQDHAALAICSHKSRARNSLHGVGARPARRAFSFSVRQYRYHGPSFRTASMKALSMRTELLL